MNCGLQFEFIPPSFFRNHSSAHKDGFGNAGVEVKARIASGNAEDGNYAVTAVLYHSLAPRGYQNGARTDIYQPSIVAGRAFRRVTLLSAVGGNLPAGKITLVQNRSFSGITEWKGQAASF
jgi:hypothetical protein